MMQNLKQLNGASNFAHNGRVLSESTYSQLLKYRFHEIKAPELGNEN